jgi:hypothetical protein
MGEHVSTEGELRDRILAVDAEICEHERTHPEHLFLQGHGHAVRERHALSGNRSAG